MPVAPTPLPPPCPPSSRQSETSNASRAAIWNIKQIADALEPPPHFEFSERERVGYFQLKASVSLSVSQLQITVIIMLIYLLKNKIETK